MLEFHHQFDGNIMLKDSDEAVDQENFWDDKEKLNKRLLENVNSVINAEMETEGPNDVDPFEQKKSLRNTFNF